MSRTPNDYPIKIHPENKVRDFKKIFVKKFLIFYILLIIIIAYALDLAYDYAVNVNLEKNNEKSIFFFCPQEKNIVILNDKNSSLNILKINSFGRLLFDPKYGLPYFLTKDGRLIYIDPVKNIFAKTYKLDFAPLYGAFANNGNIYISDRNFPYIYAYSLISGKITYRIKQDHLRRLFTIGARSKNLAGYNALNESIDIINLKQRVLIERFPNIKNIKKIITPVLGNKIILLNENNKFLVINMDIKKIEKKFTLGKNIADFALSNNNIFNDIIYAADKPAKKLYVIKSGKIKEEKSLRYEPYFISLSPEGCYAYIYYKNAGKLEKINLANMKTVKIYDLKNIDASQMIVVNKPTEHQ